MVTLCFVLVFKTIAAITTLVLLDSFMGAVIGKLTSYNMQNVWMDTNKSSLRVSKYFGFFWQQSHINEPLSFVGSRNLFAPNRFCLLRGSGSRGLGSRGFGSRGFLSSVGNGGEVAPNHDEEVESLAWGETIDGGDKM